MVKFKIDKERCKGCGLCVHVCPKHLLKLADEVTAKGYHICTMADVGSCVACASCAIMCPDSCIEIWKE